MVSKRVEAVPEKSSNGARFATTIEEALSPPAAPHRVLSGEGEAGRKLRRGSCPVQSHRRVGEPGHGRRH